MESQGFDKLLDENYGEGSSTLWLSGGNTLKGFWNQDQNGSLNAVTALCAAASTGLCRAIGL